MIHTLPRAKTTLAVSLVLLLGASVAVAKGGHPKVAPPHSSVAGMSYGQWTAAWWQWALSLPAVPGHPFIDDPAFDVRLGQTGKVWFLAAPFGTVTRDISIPEGTRLFVAILNVEASSLETPPFYGATEAAQRAAARAFADYIQGPFLSVDGESLDDLDAYRVASPQFAFTVPDPNVLFVAPGSGTAVSDGYWAMIGPLSKGKHTIHFGGAFVGTPFGDFGLDMTYRVTVQ